MLFDTSPCRSTCSMDPALNIFALNENAAHVALIRGNRSSPIASTGVGYISPRAGPQY